MFKEEYELNRQQVNADMTNRYREFESEVRNEVVRAMGGIRQELGQEFEEIMIRTLERSALGESLGQRMYTADENDINLNNLNGSRSVSDEDREID